MLFAIRIIFQPLRSQRNAQNPQGPLVLRRSERFLDLAKRDSMIIRKVYYHMQLREYHVNFFEPPVRVLADFLLFLGIFEIMEIEM